MKTDRIKHIGIIMDGNGRWAKQRNLPRVKGHYEGGKRIKEVAIAASEMGVEKMSVYAFSTENWKRPEEEVNYIFKLPRIFLDLYLRDLMKHQIRINYIGDLTSIPDFARKAVEDSIKKTKNNTGMELIFALNYGSRAEILLASKKMAQDFKDNNIELDNLDEIKFSSYLMDNSDVDLLIRTSGEQRLSNFLLWQIAYSEIYFTKVLWPDFTKEEFEKALEDYYQRDRRFGGIKNA